MKRAKIIVIEGTDGSGKETQSKKLEEYYKIKNLKVKRYSFPIYDSPTGKIIGGPYLGKGEIGESYFEETSANVDPLVSSLYYAADRRYNFLKYIEKDIYNYDILILDRYTTSNMGHQVCKGKSKKERLQILKFIEVVEFEYCELPRPDLVLFLHMPLEATIKLRENRKYSDGNESNSKYLKKSEDTYVELSKYFKWNYINCIKSKKFKNISDIKSIDDIHLEIIKICDKYLKDKTAKIEKMTRF